MTESSTAYRNLHGDPEDETFDWHSDDDDMADQDPSNLNNDKFTVIHSDGATRPPNILATPQNPENQKITQTSPTLPTFPPTQVLNAEPAPSPLSTTPHDTVTSQDTALIAPSVAYDASEPFMTAPTDSTPDPGGAAKSADSNQASNLSQPPTPAAIPANNEASKNSSQLPVPKMTPADTQQNVSRSENQASTSPEANTVISGITPQNVSRSSEELPPHIVEGILALQNVSPSGRGSMEAFGVVNQVRSYEVSEQCEN